LRTRRSDPGDHDRSRAYEIYDAPNDVTVVRVPIEKLLIGHLIGYLLDKSEIDREEKLAIKNTTDSLLNNIDNPEGSVTDLIENVAINEIAEYLSENGDLDEVEREFVQAHMDLIARDRPIREARSSYEKILEHHMDKHGSYHPQVAMDARNLGLLLQATGDLEEARKLYETARAISLANLDSLLQGLGKAGGYGGRREKSRR